MEPMRPSAATANPERRGRLTVGAAIVCVAVAWVGPAAAQEASSDNYVMEVSATGMAGGRSESASFRVADSVGLGVEPGPMESASYRATAGPVISGDADGDGVSGGNDQCPEEHSACYDLDFDGCIDMPDVDVDADGVTAGACDCNEADATIWATPGEVADLQLARAASDAVLSWDPPAAPGGTAPRYDTVRSGIASNFDPGIALCLETDDDSDTGAVDPAVPASGGIFHYLVRAENDCAAGTGPTGTSQGLYDRSVRDCS